MTRLEDLRVAYRCDDCIVSDEHHTRDATVSDLVAALQAEGAQPLWWCENHSSNGVGPRCDVAITYATGPDTCPMVEGWWMPTGGNE